MVDVNVMNVNAYARQLAIETVPFVSTLLFMSIHED